MSDSSSAAGHYGTEQEHKTFKFIVICIFGMAALNIPASLNGWGWKSAYFNTVLVLTLTIAYAIWKKERRLGTWILVGVGAGFAELAADWWLVHKTQSLVYAPNEPMLVASPAYMPGAWALVILQMGMVAHWLRGRMSVPAAIGVVALICGFNIPLYEHLAKGANWWFYQDTPMVFAAPYYIIVGEMILGAPLVWIAGVIDRKWEHGQALKWGIPLGVLEGIIIFVAYVIAWWLVGPCSGSVIQFPCGG